MHFPGSTMTVHPQRRRREGSWTCWIFLFTTVLYTIHMQTPTTDNEWVHLSPGKETQLASQMVLEFSTLAVKRGLHTYKHTHTGNFWGLVSKKHAVKMILMLEIMATLVMDTYHSRYMALLKGRLERDRKNMIYKPMTWWQLLGVFNFFSSLTFCTSLKDVFASA